MGQARDYEALIRELLDRVAGVWSYGNVTGWLMGKNLKERDLAQWLRKKGATLGADAGMRSQLGCLASLGRGELAEVAGELVKVWESEAYEWFVKGKYLVELGNYEEAISVYNQVIKIKPNDDEAWYNKGVLFHKLERYEEAIPSYEQAIKIDISNDNAMANLGSVLASLGKYEEAIANYEQAIKIKPDKDGAWYNRGVVLTSLGKYEETISSYEQAIKIKPDKYDAWVNKGIVLAALEKYEKAISSYEHAIKIKLDKDIAWFNRGIAIGKIHGYQSEINAYQKAFEHIKPDTHPEGWGILQHKIGSTHYREGCKQLFHRRCNPHIYYGQALTHYHNALTTLTREQFPKLRLETLIDTAKVYLAQHNTSDAHKCKTEAFDIFQDLLNAQPTFESKKRLQLEYTSFRQLDVDWFIANGDNTNALVAAEQEKNDRLTWLLSAFTDETISPSYAQMRQLLGIKSASTTLNIQGLDKAITLPLAPIANYINPPHPNSPRRFTSIPAAHPLPRQCKITELAKLYLSPLDSDWVESTAAI